MWGQPNHVKMGRFLYSLLLLATILQNTEERCGIRKVTSHNVMEHEAVSGEFPWQVFLKPDVGSICSGTIIGEFWILSSAHCFTDMTTTVSMKAGELDVDFQGKVYPISKLIPYANNNGKSSNHLTLLETYDAIVFNDLVRPACFPFDDPLDAEHLNHCWVTTLKKRTQEDSTVNVLMKIPFTPMEPCHFDNRTRILCATATNGKSSDCTINRGDALLCQHVRTDAWLVVGIAAMDKTECNTTVIFTRTASYITWVKESTAMEGKPILPEISSLAKTKETTKEKHLLTIPYYNEELPSSEDTDYRESHMPDKESKLKARKMIALALFYTQVFLVFIATSN